VSTLRWGWVFLERTRILSGIQFITHFIDFFVVETKRFVEKYPTPPRFVWNLAERTCPGGVSLCERRVTLRGSFLYELRGCRYVGFCWCHSPPPLLRTLQTLSAEQGPDIRTDVWTWWIYSLLGQLGPTVCCFVLLKWYLGIVTVPGFLHEPRGYAPTIENRWRTSSRCPPLDNPGGLDPHPPLNVAGCTNPILYLFERTQQLTPLTTGGKPWWLCVWTSPKFVRPHWWLKW